MNGDLLGALAALQRDDEPLARAVGAALADAALDALHAEERAWVADIETLRARLEASTEIIDAALPNQRAVQKPAELGDICRRRSKKQPWGVFLLALARTLSPQRCLELGTGLGISSAYLAAGLRPGGGELVTLEGAAALAQRAGTHLAQLGLEAVRLVPGLFADTLGSVLSPEQPFALAFIDGHHQELPTLAYFDQICVALTARAVVVFDDISWSEGMEGAWAAIVRDPCVRVAIDIEHVGVCVVGPPSTDPPRVYRFPTITTMQRALHPVAAPSAPTPFVLPAHGVARLNWGCGPTGEPGWINSDLKQGPNIDISADIRDGLPIPDACLDYIVSIHALSMIPLPDVPAVLSELRRMLKPSGTLRLGLADLDRAIDAYRASDTAYFVVPDRDAVTLSGKLITQLLWYGYAVTLFTAEFVEELLVQAGFSSISHCAFGETASTHEGITDLDNRENESFFVEAVR